VSFVTIFRKLCNRENSVYRMFYLGRNFVSDLLCTLKAKNLKNRREKNIPKHKNQKTLNLKTFSPKLGLLKNALLA